MQNLQRKPRQPVNAGVKIQVEAEAMQKLWLWTDFAKGEVSCLGIVEEIADANTGRTTALIVSDFHLVKQECTSEETDMDVADIARLVAELEMKGINSRKLRCWAHSHGSMSVFWSRQDEQCIAGLANGEWMLSLVVNKRRDSIMRLDQYHPAHLYLADIAWDVVYPLVPGLAEECFSEFKAKVKESQYRSILNRPREKSVLGELKSAQERGALTDEDLLEEMDWLGLHRDDLDELEPF